MPLYPTGRATADDVAGFVTTCTHAQEDFFDTVGKARVTWTKEMEEAVNSGNFMVWICRDPAARPGRVDKAHLPYGGMIMAFHQPTADWVLIVGIATRRDLPRRTRQDVGISLLIGGYPECLARGCTRGQGHVEASNDILIETFQMVEKFTLDPERGTIYPRTVREVVGWQIEVDPLDDDYLRALHAALS